MGYSTSRTRSTGTYNISLANITAAIDQQHSYDKQIEWTKLSAADHLWTTPVPMAMSSPPVVVGGEDRGSTATSDIKMYDNSNKSWKKIGSLSSARCRVAAAAVYNNAIIIIGGCTKGSAHDSAKSSSVTLVELGQLYFNS